MNNLTKIWNMPRSEAAKHLTRIFGVDVTKPKEERKEIYDVKIIYRKEEYFSVEANSAREAIEEAISELGIDKSELVEVSIL